MERKVIGGSMFALKVSAYKEQKRKAREDVYHVPGFYGV